MFAAKVASILLALTATISAMPQPRPVGEANPAPVIPAPNPIDNVPFQPPTKAEFEAASKNVTIGPATPIPPPSNVTVPLTAHSSPTLPAPLDLPPAGSNDDKFPSVPVAPCTPVYCSVDNSALFYSEVTATVRNCDLKRVQLIIGAVHKHVGSDPTDYRATEEELGDDTVELKFRVPLEAAFSQLNAAFAEFGTGSGQLCKQSW